MKKKYILALAICLFSGTVAYAQSEFDAYRFSNNDLRGTARAVSMGGAFGALGADATGVSINPAGIGVYSSSEISATIDFQNTKSSSVYLGNKFDQNKFKVHFDNVAFVYTIPLYSDDVPLLNVGFSYNKLKAFDRKYTMSGSGLQNTLVDYMATRAERSKYNHPDDLFMTDKYNPFGEPGVDWLGALGESSYLFDSQLGSDGKNYIYNRAVGLDGATASNIMGLREKGSINTYDFNVGTTISDIISIGLTVGVTDVDYKMYSEYTEQFNTANLDEYTLYNIMETDGTGWQLKLGTIIKPINELRIGVAYHSPTWYSMTDYYRGGIFYDVPGIADFRPEISDPRGDVHTDDPAYNALTPTDYDLRTPDKWVFSAAGVIGQYAILSVDYELTNYKNMKLKDRGYTLPATYEIKRDFRTSSMIRFGAEVRVTPQFSVRAGYAWTQSPYKTEIKNNQVEAMVVGTIPNYMVDKDKNQISAGLGYRFNKHFYADMAFVSSEQKSDMYMFPTASRQSDGKVLHSDKVSFKTKRMQGLLTLGYKF